MQKWEYLEVHADGDLVSDIRVYRVNGQLTVRVRKGPLASTPLKEEGEPLHVFLKRIGEEGWELISHIYSKEDNYREYHHLVFKRPKP